MVDIFRDLSWWWNQRLSLSLLWFGGKWFNLTKMIFFSWIFVPNYIVVDGFCEVTVSVWCFLVEAQWVLCVCSVRWLRPFNWWGRWKHPVTSKQIWIFLCIPYTWYILVYPGMTGKTSHDTSISLVPCFRSWSELQGFQPERYAWKRGNSIVYL